MSEHHATRCSSIIKRALSKIDVEALAKETGFCERRRKFTPLRAIWTFVTAMACGTTKTLADIVRLFADLTGEEIQYKSFHDRLSIPGFPEFLRQTLAHSMNGLTEPIMRSNSRYLQHFTDIEAQDGSSFALNDSLAEEFPGRFTKISPAAIEIHCTYSLFGGQATAISIAPDSEAERQFLPEPEELEGKLILGDQGYTSYEYPAEVKAAGGDFLGRMSRKSFNPKILKCYRGPFKHQDLDGLKLKDLELP